MKRYCQIILKSNIKKVIVLCILYIAFEATSIRFYLKLLETFVSKTIDTLFVFSIPENPFTKKDSMKPNYITISSSLIVTNIREFRLRIQQTKILFTKH